MPLFGNYVSQISYILGAVILILTEDFILDKIIIPIIKKTKLRNKKSGKILTPVLGTSLFILWAAFGITIISFLLGFGVINSSNVLYISLITFVILMFILNKKYGMRWF